MTQSAPSYIYADNAATTPLAPEALEAMLPYLKEAYGNPSGIHRMSRANAESLNQFRTSIAKALGIASPQELFFTSGGSESDNWALRGRIDYLRRQIPATEPIYIITTAIEHHAILNTCKALEPRNVRIVLLKPDSEGFVTPQTLESAIQEYEGECIGIVSIMLANNEIGTIEDIRSLAEVAHNHHIPFHTDAVQAVGHMEVDIEKLGVDALSLSAHKFNGPHGVGALYVKSSLGIDPLITGGGQERHMRSGTENMGGIAGAEAALVRAFTPESKAQRAELARNRDRLVAHILAETTDVALTGPKDSSKRLPANASFCCKDVDGELLTVLLDKEGVAASTGSACNTGSTDPSHVIQAIGIKDERWNRGTLRLSLAEDMTREIIDDLANRTVRAIKKARLLSGMGF